MTKPSKALLLGCTILGTFGATAAGAQQQTPTTAPQLGSAPTATASTGQTAATPSTDPADASAPAPAPADTGVGEIVVTAQRRSENLQRVPIAVTALSAAQIAKAGVTDTFALTKVTPGLSVSYNAGNIQPHLRGIGTTFNGPGVESPVAIYVDGVYYASQLGGLADLSNISQISVLKGPQGTLFGRNATGGVLQINTKDPSHTFEGEATTSLDNYLTTRSNLYLSGPINSIMAANLSVSYVKQGNGYGENIATGEDVHRIDDSVSVRGKLLIEPSSRTTIHLGADFTYRKDSLGPNLVPYRDTLQILPGYRRTNNPYDVSLSHSARNVFNGGGASLVIDQDLGFAKLTSTSAYRQLNLDNVIVPIATPLPSEVLYGTQPERQFTQELQLASPSGQRLTWTAGVFYYNERAKADPLAITFEGVLLPPGGLQRIDIMTDARTQSVAGYGQATYKILPKLNFTAGLRYTYEQRKFDGSEPAFLDGNIPIGSLTPIYDLKRSYKKLTWRFAVDYQLTDRILVYLSQNRGFKSGGFNGYDPTNPPYQPEQLDAYEAGLKTELFDRRLRLNFAAFHYDYTNVQVSRFTNTQVVYNGAKAKIDGVDVDFDARITSQLSLTGGLEFLDGKFKNFPDAQFATPLATGGNDIFYADASGRRAPYASKFTGTAALDYKIPITSGEIDLNVNASHNSGFFAEPNNFIHQGAFTLLGASVAWTSQNKRVTVTAFASNLLDELVLTAGQTHPEGYSVDFANPPRLFGGSVSFKF